MVAQGILQVYNEVIKEAGEGVPKARHIFGRLCGGEKDSSNNRGIIGNLFTQQLQGVDIGKEEDMRMMKKTAVQANEKAHK